MFCPECRGEFVSGVEVCNNCQVALVPQLEEQLEEEPFEEEAPAVSEADTNEELVTVFASGDSSLLAIAGSLLEEQGIPYSTSGGGEGVQDLLGFGRLGPFGFNFLIGPVPLRVRERDAELARELLRELDTPPEEGELPDENE